MLKINIDESKTMQFDVHMQGIDHTQLEGRLKFVVEGVEYGFSAKVLADHVSVVIPPLNSIIKKKLSEGDQIEGKLDVYGNGFHVNPWKGKFQLERAVKVEVKRVIDGRKKSNLVEVVSNTGKVFRVSPETAKKLNEKLQKPTKKIKVAKAAKVKAAPTVPTTPQQLMESVGMKNKHMQKLMIEKAEEMGGEGNKAVMKSLETILGIKNHNDPLAEMERIHDKIRLAEK